jgi:hypothetical protein
VGRLHRNGRGLLTRGGHLSETNGDVIRFGDLQPQGVRFELYGKEYVLREPSIGAAKTYKQTRFRDPRVVNGQLTADASQMHEADSRLLRVSVFDAKGNNVSEQEFLSWPNSLLEELLPRAKKMARIDQLDRAAIVAQVAELEKQLAALDKAEGVEKNLPATTTAS